MPDAPRGVAAVRGRAGGALAGAARRQLAARLARLRGGQLELALPDGTIERHGTPGAPVHRLDVHDTALFARVLRGGETGFGEAYVDGLWDTPDLPALLAFGLRNRAELRLGGPLGAAASARRRLAHRLRANTRAGSRKNIHEHYDLGNAFFALFLDETLTYSSAVFETPGQSFADAQRNKYRLACDALGLGPGMRVLEVGCGWGGFAEYAIAERGCQVTGVTISREQYAFARDRLAPFGASADIQLRDYRDISGEYDALVSIEMIEAVGLRYLPAFFAACAASLAPGGRLFVQAITVPAHEAAAQRRGANWLQQYIFPGGELLSIAHLERAAGSAGLRLAHFRDIGAHYAPTLRAWSDQFEAALPAVRELGFDERFVRTWRYYLASCEAVFAIHIASDLHLIFDRAP